MKEHYCFMKHEAPPGGPGVSQNGGSTDTCPQTVRSWSVSRRRDPTLTQPRVIPLLHPSSNVEHGVPQLRMNSNTIRPARRRTNNTCGVTRGTLKHIGQIPPAPLTENIGMIRWRTDTHGLGGSRVRVTQGLSHPLQFIRGTRRPLPGLGAEYLIQHHDIVRGPRRALDGGVALQEEIPVPLLRDAAVHHGARLAVAAAVHALGVARVEARVVALANNNDGQLGEASLGHVRGVFLAAGLLQEGYFVLEDEVVLAFGHAVAVDDNVLRKAAVFAEIEPVVEHLFEHGNQIGHHFLPSQLLPGESTRHLTAGLVNSSDHTSDRGRRIRRARTWVRDVDTDQHCLALL